jgi:flagellar basal body-associated protein FliL
MYQPILLDANWNNGVIMIAIFALVCVALVGILISFLMSGKKKNDSENLE